MARRESTPSARAVVRAVMRMLPRAGDVAVVRRLEKGRSHAAWVLTSAAGPMVAKVPVRDTAPELLAARLVEHRRAQEHGVAVSPLIGWERACRELAGRPLIVFAYLPGQDAEELFPRLSAQQRVDAMRRTGAVVAELHAVPVRAFGQPSSGMATGPGSWLAVVLARLEELSERHAEAGIVRSELLGSAVGLIAEVAGRIDAVVRPALVHLDVHLPNLLLDARGRFVALLDTEHLRRVDPVMDFVKPAMWIFEQRPECAAAFAEGYRSAAVWPERFADRFTVAAGLELLTGLLYWERVRDRRMGAEYLCRLGALVRSRGHAMLPAVLAAEAP